MRRSRWPLDAEVRADRGGWGRRGGAHSSRVDTRALLRDLFLDPEDKQTQQLIALVKCVCVWGSELRCVWGACAHVSVWRAAAPRAARSSSVFEYVTKYPVCKYQSVCPWKIKYNKLGNIHSLTCLIASGAIKQSCATRCRTSAREYFTHLTRARNKSNKSIAAGRRCNALVFTHI